MATKNEKTYLANDITPAFPVHPGSILGEELKARGISQKQFAETVGLQATHLNALIHGTRNFTPAVADRIASGLESIPASFWLKAQDRYRIDVQRKRLPSSRPLPEYGTADMDARTACLAQPQVPYNGRLEVILSIPESDKEWLETLAGRFGWSIH